MFARSARSVSWATAMACLPTGTDSPVSIDSSAVISCTEVSRMSAGTRLPAAITTRSPGTSPTESISCAVPPRTTRAVVRVIADSA